MQGAVFKVEIPKLNGRAGLMWTSDQSTYSKSIGMTFANLRMMARSGFELPPSLQQLECTGLALLSHYIADATVSSSNCMDLSRNSNVPQSTDRQSVERLGRY